MSKKPRERTGWLQRSGQKNTRQKRVDNKKPARAGVYKTR
jgi:hypothetical protein